MIEAVHAVCDESRSIFFRQVVCDIHDVHVVSVIYVVSVICAVGIGDNDVRSGVVWLVCIWKHICVGVVVEGGTWCVVCIIVGSNVYAVVVDINTHIVMSVILVILFQAQTKEKIVVIQNPAW